jgi:uncharacterized protein (TIGR03437 family)
MRSSRYWILWGTLAICIATRAQGPAGLNGIYIYTNDVSQVTSSTSNALTTSLGIPGVDGVAVVIGWDAIEPSMGQYQWNLLDQWIGKAVSAGKRIDLVVPAGASTPSWLFQPAPGGAGATPLNSTITPHDGQTNDCQAETIAAPWDTAFLSQWDAMLAALSAHLKTAGTYGAITLLRLTGVNRTTEELRLPAETAQSTGLACVTDAIATWQQAGYKPSLLLQGWNAIIGSFQNSFPDKPFAVSIIPSNAFPAIAEDGSVIMGTRPDSNTPLLQSANRAFPGRLVIQFDFLMTGEVASSVVIQYAQTLGTPLAFQTNEYLGGRGAACSEPVSNPTQCTDATFLSMLQTGIYPLGQTNPQRSRYIEVFHDNASAFPDDILQAHYELTQPAIAGVVNAESGSTTIAPNTWVEIGGSNLGPPDDSRVWQASDFVGGEMPTALDDVSVTVNGTPAYIYYISPTQVNILTPPGAMPASVAVQLTVNGSASAAINVPTQSVSPSFFVFNGGPYVAAQHADYSPLGPANLYPGLTTPAKPGEIVLLYANGFGATNVPVVSGSETQSGTLSPLPVIAIGGVIAVVKFAGLVAPGEYQFNVAIPANALSGDNALVATYNGFTTPVALITIQGSVPATSDTFYVAPYGSDSWSGTLAAPQPANTDGPFATFDAARAAVRALNKKGLNQVTVQFRGGTYFLPATEMFTAADSGSTATQIVYQNYPGESPVFSGGMRIQNWTNVSGNKR